MSAICFFLSFLFLFFVFVNGNNERGWCLFLPEAKRGGHGVFIYISTLYTIGPCFLEPSAENLDAIYVFGGYEGLSKYTYMN